MFVIAHRLFLFVFAFFFLLSGLFTTPLSPYVVFFCPFSPSFFLLTLQKKSFFLGCVCKLLHITSHEVTLSQWQTRSSTTPIFSAPSLDRQNPIPRDSPFLFPAVT
eukprot:TRINITY_DN616_c0_g1_i1.p2 TRINITY_DN616_c0_g1~~TRINITY_DN616_c0_g1_i1.p2  ORF type:complete len:106 (-),score=7.42 TRINITY_DN616_c0_g1_i1:710-1027(-)